MLPWRPCGGNKGMLCLNVAQKQPLIRRHALKSAYYNGGCVLTPETQTLI